VKSELINMTREWNKNVVQRSYHLSR